MSIRETLAAALAAAFIAAGCSSDEVVLDQKNVLPLREASATGCNLMQRLCDFYLVTEPATVRIGTKIRIINADGAHEYEVESFYVRSRGPNGTEGPMREVNVSLVGEDQELDALLLPEHLGTVEMDEIEDWEGRLRNEVIGAKLVFYQYVPG